VAGPQPANRFGEIRFGRWRYRLVARTQPYPDLIVVTLPAAPSLEWGRQDLVQLIHTARLNGARALVFDFRMERSAETDARVCASVNSANARQPPMPVVTGYGFHPVSGDMVRTALPATLAECFPLSSAQGHVLVFGDSDRQVRSLPLYFRDATDRPALSLRIAELFGKASAPKQPGTRLLQIIPPDRPYPELGMDELQKDTTAVQRFRDRVVLVGEDSDAERFSTPWADTILGVQLQAQAAQVDQVGSATAEATRNPNQFAGETQGRHDAAG